MHAFLMMLEGTSAQWSEAMWRASWQGALAIVLVWGICRLFPRRCRRSRIAGSGDWSS